MTGNVASSLPPAVLAGAMALAVKAAQRFEGGTAPNPPVGCVLLDVAGNILATAAHERAGLPHAEAAALESARMEGTLIRAHTLVVTLEPCNHFGRTGPCTQAILASPVKHVIVGVADPNPYVAGAGAARLREAGLSVSFLEGERSQVERLIAPFRKRMVKGLPYVTVKQALQANGSMIPPEGQKTFTSQGSLVLAHALRRRADAILTGSGTVLADNPQFTVRLLPDHTGKTRPLVIMDRRRRVPEAYLKAAVERGFDPVQADDLETTLRDLAQRGVLEVLVEAGPELCAHVLNSPFWDEHIRIKKNGVEDTLEIRTPGGTHVLGNH